MKTRILILVAFIFATGTIFCQDTLIIRNSTDDRIDRLIPVPESPPFSQSDMLNEKKDPLHKPKLNNKDIWDNEDLYWGAGMGAILGVALAEISYPDEKIKGERRKLTSQHFIGGLIGASVGVFLAYQIP